MNTDTPRTDDQSVRYYDDATGTRIKYVAAKFARQLERELAQRERERDEWKEKYDRLAEALNEFWYNHSLTGSTYELIEQALQFINKPTQ